MVLQLGDKVPDFIAETTQGMLDFYDYIYKSWVIIFSHPDDFTPVCTTELAAMAKHMPEFEKRGVKVLALSCNSIESHKAWIPDIETYMPGVKVNYPIIADEGRELASKFGMIDPSMKDTKGEALTARAVFIIGPNKKLKLSLLYPATTGRNMEEIIRVLDSLQLTAEFDVATPADWQVGDDCMIHPELDHEVAAKSFPKGFKTVRLPSMKKYMRFTPHPVEGSVRNALGQFASVLKACELGLGLFRI